MKRRGWIITIIVAVLVLLFLCLGVGAILLVAMGETSQISRISGPNSVAVIHIEGVIASSSDGGLLGVSTAATPETVIKQIREANKDRRVGAILLRIDSPGGSAAASQEIYREIKRSKKPVVASIGDVGASGGYYIASAADEIVASPASAVGSIGVIMTAVNLEELYKKLGVKFVVITRGKYKDIGSESRPMTDEERKILEEQATIIYEQFIDDVAKARNMPREKVAELATGLAWPASQAKGFGLVDQIGNYQDAVKRAGKLGKIEGEPQVIRYDQPTFWEILTQATSEARAPWREILKALERAAFPAEQNIPR